MIAAHSKPRHCQRAPEAWEEQLQASSSLRQVHLQKGWDVQDGFFVLTLSLLMLMLGTEQKQA